MNAPLLETRGLTKTFGGLKAVQQVGLRVEAQRIVSVIGPNGAGKTTAPMRARSPSPAAT
jgi:ABC-type branched-subunit amino acid transport system ATPase component